MRDQLNELISQLRALLAGRSQRELGLIGGAIAVVVVFGLYSFVVQPMQAAIDTSERLLERREGDLVEALRRASDAAQLREEVALVEAKIKPGEDTQLVTLVSALAAGVQLDQQQLQRISEKSVDKRDDYPEKSAVVQLQGVTILQTAQLLYAIEKEAGLYLIIRSIVIKQKQDGGDLVDVTFTVSSFRRGA